MKTAVVTGGNRGIGRAVTEGLARAGHRVVFLGRDEPSGRALESALPEARFVRADLGSVAGARDAAGAILREAPRIDVLVHNAGIWPVRAERNGEGIERAFAVNHLAPFVLNDLLAPALARGGRVVQVTAGLYIKGRIDLERTPRGEDFHPLWTYATTKLCNLLLLGRFAERLVRQEVTLDAIHPGVVRTGLGDRPGLGGLVLRAVKLLWSTPEEGASHVVRLATRPRQGRAGPSTGAYFDRATEQPLAPVATDRVLADRVWEQAALLAGLEVS